MNRRTHIDQGRQKNRDAGTFQEQVTACERMVYGICYELLSKEDAEQAAREAILDVYRKRQLVDGSECLQNWIRIITVRCCRKWMHKREEPALQHEYSH